MFTRLIQPGAPSWLWLLGIIGDFLLFGGVLFFLLKMVPNRYRKAVVIVVTFLAGLIYSIEFFVPPAPGTDQNFMTPYREQVGIILSVVYAFAFGLGAYSLLRFHGKAMMRKRAGWHNSLALYVAFAAMLGVGLWQDAVPTSKVAANVHNLLFETMVAALGATMFSTIGFFIVSAAYRAFRIRSTEATLMLLAAFVVMLGQVPVGAYLTSGLPEGGLLSMLKFENMSYWILNEPNMAAWRAMAFGIEIGALAMALRTWLSLERGSFFEREL